LRIKVGLISAVIGIAVIYLILPKGYFGPISSRVRGLFVKHTKTGNPLVDSVAEHQAASPRAYFQYLHNLCLVAPVGFALVFWNLSDSSSFLLTWGASAYFFSHKMVHLVLLTAPIASVRGGIAAGRVLSWCTRTLWDDPAVGVEEDKTPDFMMEEPASAKNQKGDANGNRQELKKIIKKKGSTKQKSSISAIEGVHVAFKDAAKSNEGVIVQRCIAGFLLVVMYIAASGFETYCWQLAPRLSNPSIMMKGRLGDGNEGIVDDYREAYWWLQDNTPEDSRIMAWWDYGYQITAIANRTTIADGNTWNQNHYRSPWKGIDNHGGRRL
jgi:dolichyl-diphosphooligosaccharide--protein glycosyltransferase